MTQPLDPDDPWALAQGAGSYDRTKFYPRASDGKGHSERVQVRLSPGIYYELNALIQDPGTPYRTVADVIRDALVHRARDVRDMQGIGLDLNPMLRTEMRQAYLDSLNLRDEAYETEVALLEKRIESLIQMEAWDQLAVLLQHYEGNEDDASTPVLQRRLRAAIDRCRVALMEQNEQRRRDHEARGITAPAPYLPTQTTT